MRSTIQNIVFAGKSLSFLLSAFLPPALGRPALARWRAEHGLRLLHALFGAQAFPGVVSEVLCCAAGFDGGRVMRSVRR